MFWKFFDEDGAGVRVKPRRKIEEMKDVLRLGIVGCGDVAGYTAFLCRLNRGIQVVACCDHDLDKAQHFASRHRIPNSYQNYHDLLALKSLAAIYLSVPHDLHFEMAQEALRSGRHVLLEKPITRTIEEGENLVNYARHSGLCLGVNYQYRYDLGCYALAQATRSGQLGKLYYAQANIPWYRQARYFESAPWRGEIAKAGGGTLITQGSHILDILLWAMSSPPKAACAVTTQRKFEEVEVEDLAMGIVELESGALLNITSSMVAKPERAIGIEVYGERGTAIYSNQPLPHVRFKGVRLKRSKPPTKGLHALHRSLEGFRAWVLEDQPYLIPASEALPVLATISAIYKSAKAGHKEPVTLSTIQSTNGSSRNGK
jgi:predicted dehydrogenase